MSDLDDFKIAEFADEYTQFGPACGYAAPEAAVIERAIYSSAESEIKDGSG